MEEKGIVGVACDHAGYLLKLHVVQWLKSKGYEVRDFGTNSLESCDYPDFGHSLGYAIDHEMLHRGVAICGSGEGISMTLNHHPSVRAALCWRPEIARLSRQHNDANVLVMPGRFISLNEADAIMAEFFDTAFEGGRHERRVAKIKLHDSSI